MKKQIVLGVSVLICSLLHAQNSEIKDMAFSENNKSMEALAFANPTMCDKAVLVNTWKDFIHKHKGKTKGGVFNKATGTGIKFNIIEWNGSFAYAYNEDNTMTLFTSFYDSQNRFLSAADNPEEYPLVKEALMVFKKDIENNCYVNDQKLALNYKNSLIKEKTQNESRISSLSMALKKDSINLSHSGEEVLTQKQAAQAIKIKQSIASRMVEIDLLEKRNAVINEETEAQDLVIEDFKKKIDRLNNPDQYREDSYEYKAPKAVINEEPENTEFKEEEEDVSSGYDFDR